MGKEKYAVGIDFGTLSGRAVLARLSDGEILAQSALAYRHGVYEETLPDGTKAPSGWALQDPADYLEVLFHTVPEILKAAGVCPENVVGIGVDVTSCTMFPVDERGIPLCFQEKYKNHPHAYGKLWKHHAAQPEADRLNRLAAERGEDFLLRYGNKVSSEWMFPKLMEICEEAPEIYEAAARFIEAADWLPWMLTGKETRAASMAGYKALWHESGYPPEEFLASLHPLLRNAPKEKLGDGVLPQGSLAGHLTKEMAEKLGLSEQTAVSVGNIDAHVALPSVGITEPGKLLMILGTSTCDILCGEDERHVPGICGVVKDGALPGLYGYEAGQPCVGDMLDWFSRRCVPESYKKEAEAAGVSLQELLTKKAERLIPGESGLLALDWWNGNRSVLVDSELSGMILGLTLKTKPEEIYRALIEATAFGQRMIIENFEAFGVPVKELYACGGIAKKNPMMMQIYADVCKREIFVGKSDQCPALGSAMFGAVAAGKMGGGYDTIGEAAAAMGHVEEKTYVPMLEHADVYDRLYREYERLYAYFGRGENGVMKRLLSEKRAAGEKKRRGQST